LGIIMDNPLWCWQFSYLMLRPPIVQIQFRPRYIKYLLTLAMSIGQGAWYLDFFLYSNLASLL
jgi:hypothetical protein